MDTSEDYIEIPTQTPRMMDGKRCDYFYDRSQRILVAAYPEMRGHFEKGYLYIGNVSVSPCNDTHEPLTGLWLDILTPQSISWDRQRFRLRGKTINLEKLRQAIAERQKFHDGEHAKWDAAEKTHAVYEITLTPAEANHLLPSKRCTCGHLEAFHEYSNDGRYCEIPGCECSE